MPISHKKEPTLTKHCTDDERTAAQREAQEAIKRTWAETMDTFRRMGDRIGLFHICCERACRRAKRCVEKPRHGLHPCWAHYRAETRYLVRGMKTLVEKRDAERAASGARPPPAPKNPITLLEALYGPDLTRLRRLKGAPESDMGADFEGFDRYMLAGDWREPFRAPPRTG
jgi:hypothetical protein